MVTISVELEERGLGWAAENEAFLRQELAEDTPRQLRAHDCEKEYYVQELAWRLLAEQLEIGK